MKEAKPIFGLINQRFLYLEWINLNKFWLYQYVVLFPAGLWHNWGAHSEYKNCHAARGPQILNKSDIFKKS